MPSPIQAAPPPRPLTPAPLTRLAHQWGTLHPRYDESFEIDVTNPNATVKPDTALRPRHPVTRRLTSP